MSPRNKRRASRKRTSSTHKPYLSFKRLTRKFRSVSADDNEVSAHRLVSDDTYVRWLSYQRELKDVRGPEHIDHSWPVSRLDPNEPYHRLIGTNVVNFSPMNETDNIRKSNKVIPELLLEQVTVANRFACEVELSDEERVKFLFLAMMYSEFVDYQLEIELRDFGILR